MRWGWQAATRATPDGLHAMATGLVSEAGPAESTAPESSALFALTSSGSAVHLRADNHLPEGPVAHWPVQALRLQGIWQQADAFHAVLGHGLEQVVVTPGQKVGREAYRVLRVTEEGVALQAPQAGQALLHLGWKGSD